MPVRASFSPAVPLEEAVPGRPPSESAAGPGVGEAGADEVKIGDVLPQVDGQAGLVLAAPRKGHVLPGKGIPFPGPGVVPDGLLSARLRQPETGTMVRPPPTERRMQAASSRAARRSRSTWGWSRSTGTSSGGAPSWRGCARSIRTSGPWQVCSRRSRRGLMLPPPAGSCG